MKFYFQDLREVILETLSSFINYCKESDGKSKITIYIPFIVNYTSKSVHDSFEPNVVNILFILRK